MQSGLARKIEIDTDLWTAPPTVPVAFKSVDNHSASPSRRGVRVRNRALSTAIALSLAAHAAAALVVAGYSLRAPQSEPQAIPLELIALAAEPQSLPAPQETPLAPVPTVAEAPKPESPPTQERIVSTPERSASAPLPKARPVQAPLAPAQIVELPAQPPAAAALEAPMRTALAIPHESSKTTITDDVRAGLIGQYAALLHAQIVRHRIYPEQALRRGEEGVVKLRLVLTRDGALREVKSMSDNPVRLVAASLEAVQAAVPFPPLPAALGSNEETFEVAVVYKIR